MLNRRSMKMIHGRSTDLRTTRATATRMALFGAGLVIVIVQLFDVAGLRLNTSPSLPVGLYMTTADPAAVLVEFCPASSFARLALSRQYRSAGNCKDGGAPLLKPVVAKSGDVVDVSRMGILVNGRAIPNTAPLTTDTSGRQLTAWPPGRYVVPPGDLWVASSFNHRSFDSRYFGPVSILAVRHRIRPLITAGR
jgi:conjugative transfer signal peptidase TraF